MTPELRVFCAICIISIVSCVVSKRDWIFFSNLARAMPIESSEPMKIGAKNRNARLKRRRQNAVLVRDLGKLAAQQMQEFADRIRAAQLELIDDAADPFVGFLIFLAVGENVADAA